MSSFDVEILIREGHIEFRGRIPVNFDASSPIEHLSNEGAIEKAINEAGRMSTERLYQEVADKYNGNERLEDEHGYQYRQDHQNAARVISPYGELSIRRSHFYNDHLGQGAKPFESETGMEKHLLTPMAQYVLLRMLAEKGPAASARQFEEERGVKVSHHLIDRYLEDIGMRYQEVREEFLKEVIEEGWRPRWRPCLCSDDDEVARDNLADQGAPSAPTTVPFVQMDGMNVGVRDYEVRMKDGKPNRQKYQLYWREVHNVVTGQVLTQPARKPGDPIETVHRRYFSALYNPDTLPGNAKEYLQELGLNPGQKVILCGDGAPVIWRRYKSVFEEFDRIEILDDYHARKNLWMMAELAYKKTDCQKTWVEKRMADLYEGRYSSFFNGLNHQIRKATGTAKEEMKARRRYFRHNKERIRYADFLKAGYPISTCLVESANNHVVAKRVRSGGRSYADYRLQIILDFRCEYKSDRLAYAFQRLLETEKRPPLKIPA